MDNGRPLFWSNGFFRYPNGRYSITSRDAKVPVRLGDRTLTSKDIYSLSYSLAVPRSLLAALYCDMRYFSGMSNVPIQAVGFYDIETDGKGNFLFGMVRGGDCVRKFENPIEMVEALDRYSVVVGFNSYRFDNEILAKHAIERFEAINLPRFTLRVVRKPLNLDALLFYTLRSPLEKSHKMVYLAKDMGLELPGLDDKKKRCKTELEALSRFWPEMAAMYDWLVSRFRIDPYTLFSLPMIGISKLRRWCLQSWLLQRGVMAYPYRADTKRKPTFYRHHKKGYYRDVHSYDVKGAYATTAASMELSLYEKGDFSSYMRFLLGEREKNPDIQGMIKYITNATIGDMGNPRSLVGNKEIMASVWLGFRKRMLKWVKAIGKANIAYSYTDGFYTTKAVDFGDTAPYTIKERTKLKEMAVYNASRILCLDENGKVFRYQFQRAMPALGMWQEIDRRMDEVLQNNFRDVVTGKFVPKFPARLLPAGLLKIVVYKNTEECRNLELWEYWSDLQMGFNEIYLARDGMTADTGKIDYRKYDAMIRKYIRLYRIGKGVKV